MNESEPVLVALMISDTAIIEANTNKLSLIGCFTQFNLPSFPAQVAPFYATAVLTNIINTNSMKFAINLSEPDTGHVLASNAGSFGKREGNIDREEIFELPIPLAGVTFHKPGKYEINVLLDGEKIGSRKIKVNSLPQTK